VGVDDESTDGGEDSGIGDDWLNIVAVRPLVARQGRKDVMAMESPLEQARWWRDPRLGDLDLLRATFVTHTYPRHMHDEFVIGVIEDGVQGFTYRGANHTTPTGGIFILNPAEAHTGYAAVATGYTYRVLYPSAALLQRAASNLVDRPRDVPFFSQAVIDDRTLARILSRLHRSLETPMPGLERESRLLWALGRLIARHADTRQAPRTLGQERPAIQRTRAYIEAHYAEDLSLERLATLVGFNPFYFLRTFHREVGLPPHAYLESVRIARAKQLLAVGRPPAQVARATGFVDQSHFTTRFRRFVGVTPGRYAHACT